MTDNPCLGAEDSGPHTIVGRDGVWRVETETAIYVLDLERQLAGRRPGRVAGTVIEPGTAPVARLRRDGEPIPLIQVTRCVLGEPMQLVLDVRGDGILTIRATTAVVRIERCPPAIANEDGEGSGDR